MTKKYFFTPLFVGGMILANVGWADGTQSQPQQGVSPEQGRQQQGMGQQTVQAPARQEQGVGQQTVQAPAKQEQGTAKQTEQSTVRQEQGLGQQTEQGQTRQGMGQQQGQQPLPAHAPKMIVVRAKQTTSGQEQQAEVFTLQTTTRVENEQSAQEVMKQIAQQRGAPVQQSEQEQSNVPAQVRQHFQQVEQSQGGGVQPDWGFRWRYWNSGVYGYGWRPYYGYGYRSYYPTYGYYWNTGFYPYRYGNYYYPYGGYNYYYYYNPYYY